MKFYLFLFLIFITGAVQATDYYVSTSGNNSNNGTSESTPWQTLSKVESVCNSGTIKAGDRILFKKGDTFTGTLLVATIWGHSAKSGTATNPITFTSYGTASEKPIFLYPQGSGIAVEDRYLMWFVGVNYYVIDGLKFTDSNTSNDHKTPGACGMPIYLGANGEATTNHFLIQNVDISLCGMGIVLIGDFNKVSNCSLTNFKELKSTPDTGGSSAYEDYGANAFTIMSGSDNEISDNYVSGAWAESLDFGWNGGACEMFNSCNRNKLIYNTFYDCGGVSEFGADQSGASASDNLFAYNKIINCGGLTYCNISGNFAIQVSNNQYFNNDIVENNASRFSGPNTGMGITTPAALALIYPESLLFSYNGSPSAQYVFNLKNNVFNLSTGIDVVRTNDSKTSHANNIYKLSGGSTANVTLASSELSTSAAVFMNTTAADPISWDYTPAASSPAIDFGQNVGLTPDFAGNPVPSVPNAGILENASGVQVLTASSSVGIIKCHGGTTSVTVTASGGTAPYTGTGTFTVGAGTYSYTVTDAAGTSKTISVTVTAPTSIAASVSAGTVTGSGTTTASVTATGGTGAYTYSLDGGSYQSSSSFSGVAAGSHSVTVKDANGCSGVSAFTVSTAASTLVVTSTVGTVSCYGGTTNVVIAATGGTPPYTGTGTFSNGAGVYNFSVTDAAGTIKTISVTVTAPTAITATVTAGTVTGTSGTTTASVSASGGTPNYTYNLDGGSYQSSNSFSGVGSGNHSITIKDGRGCTLVKTFNVAVSGGSSLVITATAGSINCNGGTTTVTMSATGGQAPYSGTGTFTVSAGTYTYTITDAAGTTGTHTVTVTQPSAIVLSVSTGTIAAYGGTTSITVTASGGTPGYTYSLNGGSYQSGSSFSNIAAGTYSISVKDSKGCTAVKNNIVITQPGGGSSSTAFKLKLVSKSNESCKGKKDGKITVSASGGTAPYTYKINFGAYSSNPVFTNLKPGFYIVTGKSATGATSSVYVVISASTVACNLTGREGAGSENEKTDKGTKTLNDGIEGLKINAYPNPSASQFSLIIENGTQEDATIIVMNMNGQKVFEGRTKVYEKTIFGGTFMPGIYFAKVFQGKNSESLKLVKVK